ncbi:MotE family protein [Rhodomicrobium udaipurense]|uniref:MotE family protein n=1 Tax=Rhodomicrobium udaipurense TaxID=1202716 RepID=A0A8I1GET7_9HYPH|nr:MotE family protein [Rhodomicrobium udaipurense]MBJ7543649.1 MotE family protein [Rhodomicrobium udaipurense]
MALVAACPMSAIPAAAQQYAWGWPDEGGVARKIRVAPDAQPQWDASVDSAAKKAGEVRPKEPEPVKMPAAAATPPAANSRAAQSYCENIADAAADARFLSQKAELMKLDDELARRTALLEQKTNEYKEWLGRRNEFLRKAEQSLVELYTKVKPDAAAAQIAAMDEESASALLIKLSTKKSSAILDEMPPEKAARIVAVMIGAFREQDGPASAAAVSNEGARKDAAKSASPSRQKEDKS